MGRRAVELWSYPPFLHPATNKSGERRAKSDPGAWGGGIFGECHFLNQLAPPKFNSKSLSPTSNLPVAEMGLFLPKIYDGALSQVMDQSYPRHPQELLLADGHYDTSSHQSAHEMAIGPKSSWRWGR